MGHGNRKTILKPFLRAFQKRTNSVSYRLITRSAIFGIALFFAFTSSAFAYTGPGAGLAAIGVVIGIFTAIFLAIIGFIWYPIKRWRSAGRKRKELKREATRQ